MGIAFYIQAGVEGFLWIPDWLDYQSLQGGNLKWFVGLIGLLELLGVTQRTQ